jgi:Fe-S oxidoreductase
MARLKLEWQHHRNAVEGVGLRERSLAALPRLAPRAARFASVLNAAGRGPLKRIVGLSRHRALPRWHPRPWRDSEIAGRSGAESVALFVDTFSRWFEPENASAAAALLAAGGRTPLPVAPPRGERPLCCGRTYLSAGLLDEARAEASRLLAVLEPMARMGLPIVGLEPSCLYTLRDEIPALLPGPDADSVADRARLLEEFLDEEWSAGRPIPLKAPTGGSSRILVHGHCHQKAFGGLDATLGMLRRIPGTLVEPIESGCCGMAGAFGYQAEHYETSIAMGELALLPAVRQADAATRIVANGTSCRAQIADGAGRCAVHPAVLLAEALDGG